MKPEEHLDNILRKTGLVPPNEEVKCPCNDGAGLVKNHIDKCKYCQIKLMPDINYAPPSQTKEVKCTCGYEKENGHAPICPLYKPIDFSKFTPSSQPEAWEKEFDKLALKTLVENNNNRQLHIFIKNLLSTQQKEFETESIKTREDYIKIGHSKGWSEAQEHFNEKLQVQQKDFDARVEGFIKEVEAEKLPFKHTECEEGKCEICDICLGRSIKNKLIDKLVALAKQTLQGSNKS